MVVLKSRRRNRRHTATILMILLFDVCLEKHHSGRKFSCVRFKRLMLIMVPLPLPFLQGAGTTSPPGAAGSSSDDDTLMILVYAFSPVPLLVIIILILVVRKRRRKRMFEPGKFHTKFPTKEHNSQVHLYE